jgi:hypothetical protein
MNFNYDAGSINTILTLDTTESPPLGGQTNVLVVTGSGAITLPIGNTTAQPATPTAGMLRFNNTSGNGYLEYYDNSPGWKTLSATSGTVSSITVTTGTGLSVSSGSTQTITTSGTFALALSSILQSVSGLGTSGVVVNNAGTISAVTITGTASNIVVTNGSGTGGAPTINLATVSQGSGSTFSTINVDSYGRIIGNSLVTQSNLTTLLGTYYLPESGGTMAGTLNMGGQSLTNLATPVNPSDATTKSYVDSSIAGLEWKVEVMAASTANLTATYSNGTSGVGATLTNSGTQAAFVIDGYTASLNDRILIMSQSTQTQNGIYTVTTIGSGSSNWVLTRSTDTNTTANLNNAATLVTNGTVKEGTGWTQITPNPVINTSPIVFAQFFGNGTYTAGTGLSLTGNTFANTGVLSFSSGTTGLTPNSATTGAITLAGILAVANGGTGISTTPSSGSLLIGTTGGAYSSATLTAGTGIGITNASGSITINNSGVTSIAGTSNQITASASTGAVTLSLPSAVTITTSLTVSGLTANSMIYSGTAGLITATSAPTNGQILIGSTSSAPVLTALTAGTAIGITNGAGSITINNAGVTSNVAGTGISVSGATGAVTIGNTGVLSFSGGTTGLTPSSATTGAITLTGTLGVANGGTGLTGTPANGALAIGNGTNFTLTTLTAGTGTSITNASGSITINNTGVTSVGMTVPSFLSVTPSSVTTTGTFAVTLATETANTVFSGPTSGSAATPTFRALGYTDLPIKLYTENPSSPTANTVTGANAVAVGSGASATQLGGFIQSSGSFSTAGDAQSGEYMLRNTTTNATATEIFLDGSSIDYIVPGSTVVTFEVLISCINTAVTGAGGGFKLTGVVYKGTTAASVALIGSPSLTILGRSPSGLTAAAQVNTSTGALQIMVTGVASTTYHWVAKLTVIEVGAS